MAKGSNSGFYLQSRYEVQLFDSWGVKAPGYGDLGGLYQTIKKGNGMKGKAPMKNAALAPGLWQHMEISFQAPRFDANGNKTEAAKFIYVKLNGVTLHENINVDGPTISAGFEDEKAFGPLMIQGDHGTLAIKNMKYLAQDDLKPNIHDISFQYFEKSATNLAEAKTTKPTLQGKANALDSRLAPARDKFLLVFEGKLNIPTADNYTFTSLFSGSGSLEIDGKKVLEAKDLFLNGTPVVGTTELKAGEHAFKLWINKDLDWARPGLSLYIEKANSKSIALHASGSMPERSSPPLIAVKAESGPEMIRSFMNHNNKKLTHVEILHRCIIPTTSCREESFRYGKVISSTPQTCGMREANRRLQQHLGLPLYLPEIARSMKEQPRIPSPITNTKAIPFQQGFPPFPTHTKHSASRIRFSLREKA
jgi:hypothetical protein